MNKVYRLNPIWWTTSFPWHSLDVWWIFDSLFNSRWIPIVHIQLVKLVLFMIWKYERCTLSWPDSVFREWGKRRTDKGWQGKQRRRKGRTEREKEWEKKTHRNKDGKIWIDSHYLQRKKKKKNTFFFFSSRKEFSFLSEEIFVFYSCLSSMKIFSTK